MNATEQQQAEQIKSALQQVVDRYTGLDLVTGKNIQAVTVAGNLAQIELELGYPARGYEQELATAAGQAAAGAEGIGRVEISIVSNVQAHRIQHGLRRSPEIRNIIAVASGKGGVGKSTTAVNLALALKAEGAKVGMLDADIYGPSLPKMLGTHQPPKSRDGEKMMPVPAHGMQSMSIGYLTEEDNPMVWRGPMAVGALKQLLNDTEWVDLDYLIVDMPPGTGDIQLTLSQEVPVSGAIIVTTPQDIALLDAKKGLSMFESVQVPVLGVVENMSMHVCSDCGKVEPIFGQGGGESMAAQYDVPFLGGVPLDMSIRMQVDGGQPSLIAEPEGAVAQAYREIARKTAAKLSLRARDYSDRFPKIVVE